MLFEFGKKFLREQRLLVVAPHADDETIGAGGLISKIRSAGGKAFVMIISIGDLEHFKTKGIKTVERSIRRKELDNAMRTLDVTDYEILLEDTTLHLRLETIPRRELVNLIERKGKLATEKIKPTIICLPAPSFNQDHEAVYKAGLTACRPHLARMKAFQNIVIIADAPQLAWSKEGFHPNFYVDITDFLAQKLKAYKCHKSQLAPYPHQGSVESLELLARWRGAEISVPAAEAFQCYRFVI